MFLHDFFDSAHIYRWHVFESHYDWAVKTIDYLVLHGLTLHIKPHPNGIPESNLVVKELKGRYLSNSLVKWLDSNITNQSIFAQKPSLAISVYGSVAAEAAYAGIPCLMAGDHPGASFNIALTSTSQEDYFKHLLEPPRVTGSEKKEAIEYIAAHNQKIYARKGCSLWSYLGKSPSYVDENPHLLKDTDAESYIREECSRLIDMILDKMS
jgi:hypothetical protein